MPGTGTSAPTRCSPSRSPLRSTKAFPLMCCSQPQKQDWLPIRPLEPKTLPSSGRKAWWSPARPFGRSVTLESVKSQMPSRLLRDVRLNPELQGSSKHQHAPGAVAHLDLEVYGARGEVDHGNIIRRAVGGVERFTVRRERDPPGAL